MAREEIKKAASLIVNDEVSGFLPLPIFNAISQAVVLSPVDLYPFIKTPDGLKIIVIKRPDSDQYLAGYWHIPGKIMIPKDESYQDTIRRVLKTELPGANTLITPRWFSTDFQSTPRGKEHVESFWTILDKQPVAASPEEEVKAVDIEGLPKPFLEQQAKRIKTAFKSAQGYLVDGK